VPINAFARVLVRTLLVPPPKSWINEGGGRDCEEEARMREGKPEERTKGAVCGSVE
jgi:hypothetical protein